MAEGSPVLCNMPAVSGSSFCAAHQEAPEEITKWGEADYDKAARALVEQERKLARNSGSKGSGDFLKHFGPYRPWTDEEWMQAKLQGGINTAVGIARRDAHCALNAVPRVPEGYRLVKVQ